MLVNLFRDNSVITLGHVTNVFRSESLILNHRIGEKERHVDVEGAISDRY
jgi:hypothetical protein